jgi:Transglutaminase-like superfamily/Coenzyme PQQ synthesis protein D (PqqD)
MSLPITGDRIDLTASAHVRFCNVHGRTVLLNLHDGDYSVLDETATFLWELIRLSPNVDSATAAFAENFEISPIRARGDLMAFVNDCLSQQLLTTPTDAGRQEYAIEFVRKPATLWHAWLCSRRARISLRRRGFPATYKEHMHLRYAGTQFACKARADVDKLLQVFRCAENGVPTRSANLDCLPRSLALHRFLLAGGIAVDHCIGVQRFPFGAHAWVEIDRMPVYDSADFVEGFTTIARIPACSAS